MPLLIYYIEYWTPSHLDAQFKLMLSNFLIFNLKKKYTNAIFENLQKFGC